MKAKLFAYPLFCLIFYFTNHLNGQSASGVIAATRMIDWSQAGVQGGVPNRTTTCAALTSSAVATDINSAIANCPAGQVVLLGAGAYQISGGLNFINKSNVTLRGAGPTQTTLVFSSGNGCNGLGADICAINADNNYSGDPHNVATWTAGYAKNTASITLGAISLGAVNTLQVGSELILDQADDTSDPGDIYVCQTTGVCAMQAGDSGRPGRGQTQTVTVTSISGSGPWTIGISPGLYAPNWTAAKAPGAWWSSALPVTGVGIENLTVDHRNTTTQGAGIMFVNTANSWVKNVRSLNTSVHKHVWLFQSVHNTVRDSYFYGSNGTSESYGVDDGGESSDNLIENNIFQHVATGMIGEGAQGTVFGYNAAIDDYYISDPAWQQQDSYHHSNGDDFMLWEGNAGIGFASDDIHGTSFMLTAFRNRWSGRDPNGGGTKTESTQAVSLMAFNRYHNFVGNVLGTAGYHTNYEFAAPSAADAGNATTADQSVILLGYSGAEGMKDPVVNNDTLVKTTSLLWGNYDTVNNAARFVASEVPSGLPRYANPLPASQTLPPSFYLSTKPAFWNASAWPGIGPDVTGGDVASVGGHAYSNPAQACFSQTVYDTNAGGNIKAFDAAACYPSYGKQQASPVTITTSTLPSGTVSSAYSPVTLTAQGGTAPYVWTATGLPGGIMLSSSGQLSGTATSSGAFSAAITVTDSSSPVQTAQKTLSLTIVTAAAPQISSVNPGSATAGSPAVTLTVNGAGFASTAGVVWNGSPLATTMVNSAQLNAAVPGNMVTSPGTAKIAVNSAGLTSNSVNFSVVAGPSISSLVPSSVTAGGAAFSLTVNGAGFSSTTAVKWNGTALTTAFLGSTQMMASVPATLIGTAGTASLTATDNGVSSTPTSLAILGQPVITSLSPTSAGAGSAGFILTVNGNGYASGSAVWWNATPLATTFVSATQLQTSVSASQVATAGTASVTVSVAGITSAAATFTTNPAGSGPTITSLSPASMARRTTSFTLTLNGTGFVPGAQAYWNGIRLNTNFQNSTRLTAHVRSGMAATVGTAVILVTSGGASSNRVTFSITP